MILAEQVPDGWVVKRLSDVAHITAGGDVDPLTGSPVETDFHPHPVYANAIERSAIHSFSSVVRNPPGAVTITARGTLGYAVYREKPFTAIGRLLVVWPNERFDGRFLAQYLNARVTFAVESTGVPQLTGPQAGSYEVMLPTNLSEQKAIAAALSDADGVVAGLERVIGKKRLIKQGAMQDLLTARRRLPGFSGEWEPVNLARESHLKARIGWQGLTTNEYRDSGEYHLITGTEIIGGRVDWRRCFFVDKWRFDQDRNIQLRDGDVLLTKDGTIGKIAQVRDLPGPAALNSGVFVIRPRSDVYDSTFLFHVLRSSVFDTFLAKLTAGSTIVHLYQKDLVTFEFLAPDVAEQRAIAEALDDMDVEIQTLESRLAKARAVKEGMMQNLLTGLVRLV